MSDATVISKEGDPGCGEWCFFRDCFSVPAWGIRKDGTICFVNKFAEALLGVAEEDAVGSPCHEVVKGCDRNMQPVCTADCGIGLNPKTEDRGPKLLRIAGLKSKWIHVVPVLKGHNCEQQCVVETAVDVDRWARIEVYVQGIADCETRPDANGARELTTRELTTREQQVLSLLAEGMTQHEVAKLLHVSYTTVRTHVQRILPKVGACSIQAAVAYHLLNQ